LLGLNVNIYFITALNLIEDVIRNFIVKCLSIFKLASGISIN